MESAEGARTIEAITANSRRAPGDDSTVAKRLAVSGQRLTPQRRTVLEALRRSRTTATALELYEELRSTHPRLGRATVFRSLDSLVEAGLAQRFERPGHVYAYAPCSPRHHHHLVCRRCGQSVEIDEEVIGPLVRALNGRYSFAVDHESLDFYGICRRCGG